MKNPFPENTHSCFYLGSTCTWKPLSVSVEFTDAPVYKRVFAPESFLCCMLTRHNTIENAGGGVTNKACQKRGGDTRSVRGLKMRQIWTFTKAYPRARKRSPEKNTHGTSTKCTIHFRSRVGVPLIKIYFQRPERSMGWQHVTRAQPKNWAKWKLGDMHAFFMRILQFIIECHFFYWVYCHVSLLMQGFEKKGKNPRQSGELCGRRPLNPKICRRVIFWKWGFANDLL